MTVLRLLRTLPLSLRFPSFDGTDSSLPLFRVIAPRFPGIASPRLAACGKPGYRLSCLIRRQRLTLRRSETSHVPVQPAVHLPRSQTPAEVPHSLIAGYHRSRSHNNESLLPYYFFRGSIARLLYSLSTLHKPCRHGPCKTCFRWFATPYRMRCIGFPYGLIRLC